jgi:rfaE bifunctional protein kinase chain/domain
MCERAAKRRKADGAAILHVPRLHTRKEGSRRVSGMQDQQDQQDQERLIGIVRRFAGLRVLVVGDMVADEYILGAPLRVSREAPVLILGQLDQFTVPGGATNPGVNARTLGAEVLLAGVVGDDGPGDRLRSRLADYGVEMDGLVVEPGRPTSCKTRVVAGDRQLRQQQIVRIDAISDDKLSDGCTQLILAYLAETLPRVDALILSDYENGVISPAIIASVLPRARALGKVVVVDAHGDLTRFQGATALTPNQPEAEATLGQRISDQASLERAGCELLERTHTQGVLITRGSEGMSLFERGAAPLHLPASNLTEVFDPTGAGDTVAATFTLALTAGASMADAALLSSIAAGLVVRRLGCATNTPEELIAAVRAQVATWTRP